MRKTRAAILLAGSLWYPTACLSEASIDTTVAQRANSSESATTNKEVAKAVVYKNKKYHFKFVLPRTWRGYSIIIGTWSGVVKPGDQDERVESGPMITIRHPLWTNSNPRQDIPIMILTHTQAEMASGMVVSAAPFGPQEFSRNTQFVFCLPPRFDYSEGTGTEEVREILRNHPLHPF
jgi:hypothetical protein